MGGNHELFHQTLFWGDEEEYGEGEVRGEKWWCCHLSHCVNLGKFLSFLFKNLFLIGEKLLYNVGFCHTKCKIAVTIHIVPLPLEPLLSPHPTLLHYRGTSWTTGFPLVIYFTRDSVYMSCYFLHSTCSLPPSNQVHFSICISILSLQMGLSVPFF